MSTYSVVSAVYNVEAYLNDYFESLVAQTIDHNCLKIIIVDDGSTDSSADIVRSWQIRYPHIIEYIYKDNGGQASARNVGLDYVETEWVTFIDPDDFVSQDYFERIDREFRLHPSLVMASCSCVFYHEHSQRYVNAHPLKYRFEKGNAVFSIQDDNHPIQLSASTAFFKTRLIRESNLRMSSEVKPNFEDGLFVNQYLLEATEGTIVFCSDAIYYYRKRDAGSSTLDNSWMPGSGRVDIVPEKGYLALLKYAEEQKGYVPKYIQNTIIYDLSWYFKVFVGHKEKAKPFIEDGSAVRFNNTLRSISSYIDLDTLMDASGSWVKYEWKYALACRHLKKETPFHIAYVERIEPKAKRFLVRTCDPRLQIYLNGILCEPIEEKRCCLDCLGEEFSELFYRWYRYSSDAEVLSLRTDGNKPTRLSVRNHRCSGSVSVDRIIELFTANWNKYPQKGDVWVIMDRDTQADDNGEHFYRFMMLNHPEQDCYFVLRKSSADWSRLKSEGFKLLDFGSKEHERVLRKCSVIVSSHADGFVHSYFGDNFFQSKQFVFLQHGIIKDDLSAWLNPKPISLFLTSTLAEWESIVADGSPYVFCKSQVLLSGLPRHDALAGGSPICDRKTILIMPTWRHSLVGPTKGKGDIRELRTDFTESSYKKAWEGVINNERLKCLSESMGFPIVFFPHANMAPYLEAGFFSVPDYVEIATNSMGRSIQEEFKEAAVLITDYSSTAFETAYLRKPCLYYQFDKDEFFSGMQVYAQGYYDYEKDGFGPVAYSEEDLLSNLIELSRYDFSPQEPYRTRIDQAFPFRDGGCCERVYQAICKLDPNM